MKLLIIIGFLCLTTVFSAQLPDDFPRCNVGDVECIQNVATELFHKHKNGFSSIHFPAVEPFHVDKIVVAQGGNTYSLNINFTNLDFKGLSNMIVHKIVGFERDPKNSKFEGYAKIPKLEVEGDYVIDARVLLLPVKGKGKVSLKLDDVDVGVKFLPKVTVKDGKRYIQVQKIKLEADTTKLQSKLTNLFNGDKTLGDNFNVYLNENWKEIWVELKPAALNGLSQIISSIINGIFSDISYDDIWLN